MDLEFVLSLSVISFFIVFVAGIPFNCIKSNGTNKKVVIIGNIAFALIFAGVFVFSSVYKEYIKVSSGGSDIKESGFLSSIRYHGTARDYLLLYRSALFGGDDIAVPIQMCKLSNSVKEGDSVLLAVSSTDKSQDWYSEDRVSIGGRSYRSAENVVGIYPDISDTVFFIVLADLSLIFWFNVAEFIIVAAELRKRKKQQ